MNTSRNRNFLIEILMIVVGINIALWFEGWFDELEDAESEQQYLVGLRDDLRSDLETLDAVIRVNEARLDDLGRIIPTLDSLGELPAEEQAQAVFTPSSYLFFQPSDFTYRSMQESGDFHLLSDDETKKGILRLARQYRDVDVLQQNFIQAMDDEYIPLVMAGVDLVAGSISDPAILENQVFKNFFPYTHQDISARLVVYRSVRDETQALLDSISTQIDD